jgi:hypothetical protein
MAIVKLYSLFPKLGGCHRPVFRQHLIDTFHKIVEDSGLLKAVER